MNKLTLYLIGITTLLCACTSDQPRYVIGVSQCSEDIWRNWQNSEMKMEANFHEGVELRFTAALDNSDLQIQQIDSLVASGIDLLIVAPNQQSNVTPAIDRAFDQGISVIVFERKTNSSKFTAFVSADNYEMGHTMGEYIAAQLDGEGRVMEILGLKGSSPADDRHRGFRDALSSHPGIEVVATLQGDWSEKTAYQAVRSYRGNLQDIDFVFGHNDRTAMGARKAFLERKVKLPRLCGIDGLPGAEGGIRLVRDSLLDASYIYPTRGDQLLQLAIKILEEKPYEKEVMLTSAIVTQENANVLLLESDEVARQSQYLARLHNQADGYLKQLSTQRTITFLAVALIILLLAVILSVYLYFLQKARLADERSQMEREQLDFYTQVSHELRTPLTLIEGPLAQLGETSDIREAGAEASGLFAIIQRNTRQLTELINKMLTMQVSIKDQHEAISDDTPGSTASESPHAEPSEPTASDSNQTVLIVDDNADIRAYLRTILQDKYQVNEAADGQQGLSLANEIVPDLIVSDVMMPVMNGLEFCQRVKGGTATSHIPVILLTARALTRQQIEGYESGADAYITKPFSAEMLLARISNLLKSRHQLKNLFKAERQETTAENAEKTTKPEKTEEVPTTNSPREDAFLSKFHDFIEKNMTDSDLNVETIGAELGLSRVQLYRKVKALTGKSPVELLRTARLQAGRRLLETTGKTISEVAYEVGFTAPSYFTKCFKDEYGISPSDL